MKLRRVAARCSIVLTLLALAVDETRAQLQLARIAALVVDARGAPIAAAVVVLGDPLGAELRRSETDGAGRATFADVAPGRYLLQTRAPGAAVFELPVTVSGAIPIELTIRVPAAVTDDVVVIGARPSEPTSRGSIAGESLEAIPVRDEDDLDELIERRGAEMVDLDSGRVKPRSVVSLLATVPVIKRGDATVVASVQVLNLFDASYAYNFGNPFSGTHFGAPRTVACTVRVAFR